MPCLALFVALLAGSYSNGMSNYSIENILFLYITALPCPEYHRARLPPSASRYTSKAWLWPFILREYWPQLLFHGGLFIATPALGDATPARDLGLCLSIW